MTPLFTLLLLVAAPQPAEKAAEVARSLPHVAKASLALRKQVALIGSPRLRSAVLERLADPAFWSAPGGPCPAGHHAYPGGLAVHTLANLLHALELARVYRDVYGVQLDEDVLRAAAAWHDSAKATTLPWRDDGGCGPEGVNSGTPEHHVLGLAAAIKAGLPPGVIVAIAAAHAPPTKESLEKLCSWLHAASVLATGKPDAIACPDAQHPASLEAFVTNSSDTDYALTGAASVAAVGQGGGWERFETLRGASELQLWQAHRK